ncbi:hypothetical protein CGRA01v4_11769 [Colletotrichum graminicola]|nr:hypothetical protein CGRA01v4_11769 [Colletotrichum graminicola]
MAAHLPSPLCRKYCLFRKSSLKAEQIMQSFFGPPRSVLTGHAPDLAIGIRKSLLDPLAGLFWPYLHGYEARDREVPLRYTKSYDPCTSIVIV